MDVLDSRMLRRILGDAIAQKRVIKWGYVCQLGGLYPAQCDSVAAHGHAVTTIAAVLAYELAEGIEAKLGLTLDVADVVLMAAFHDFGEGRSGDTGATSIAIRGVCNLHSLEREGLEVSLSGLKIREKVLKLFDDYRAYGTSEATFVHVADNLEGYEKALHTARGAKEVVEDVERIFQQSLEIYRRRKEIEQSLGMLADFLVQSILLPGIQIIREAYGLGDASPRREAKG